MCLDQLICNNFVDCCLQSVSLASSAVTVFTRKNSVRFVDFSKQWFCVCLDCHCDCIMMRMVNKNAPLVSAVSVPIMHQHVSHNIQAY